MDDPIVNIEKAKEGISAQISALESRRAELDKILAEWSGPKKPPHYSVGKERVDAVKDYLEKNPRARQSDIARALSVNTGSVSQALQKLEDEGFITRKEKEGGSWVIESVDNALVGT